MKIWELDSERNDGYETLIFANRKASPAIRLIFQARTEESSLHPMKPIRNDRLAFFCVFRT
jgi:hypothetical protein